MRCFLLMVMATVLVCGCDQVDELDVDVGPDTDAGSDTDSDVDTDIDTDTDTGTDTDTDTDSDTDTDTDTGPNECDQGEYTGDLTVHEPSELAILAGYTAFTGDLNLECWQCTDLSELICLTSVSGDLLVHQSATLPDLNGLNNITTVGGSLCILFNDVLDNIDDLSSLVSVVGESLLITYNYLLPDCEVCDLLDQLTSGPTSTDVHDNFNDSCTPVPASCP